MRNLLAPTRPAHVADDRHAWRAFRYHSRTFSMAARLLPREVQLPIATLYLFCRRVDTIADQRVLEVGAERALVETNTIHRQLDATLAGRPPDDFLWQRLHEVHQRYDLSAGPLVELLDGARWDLRGETVDTLDDLIHYSNLVGGSVGAMMLPFLLDPCDRESLDAPARALGIGMQITNILRDVGEDYRELGRVYLPTEAMARHGVTRADLRADSPSRRYVALLEELMTHAEHYYEAAIPGIDALPLRCRVGIRAAARMYREILNQVRAADYDNLTYRAYVPAWRKCLLVMHDGYPRRRDKLRFGLPDTTVPTPLTASVPE
jgi:phytoene synthase